MRRLDVLPAAAGQAQRELPVADALRCLVHGDLLPVVVAVQPRQEIAGLHRHAFVHRQVDDPARHLETHQTLVRFDVARELQLIFGGPARKPHWIGTPSCKRRDGDNHDDQKSPFHGTFTFSGMFASPAGSDRPR